MTTRYLWLMLIPAALDLFLWIGPRLSFRTLIEGLVTTMMAQLPAGVLAVDSAALLEAAARVNHFAYLSVSFLGVPALMSGPIPEQTPIAPAVIDGGGLGAWLGWLVAFTLAGLLLAALQYNLIAYAMRRSAAAELPPFGPGRFVHRVIHTWLRLTALLALLVMAVLIITIPFSIVAAFLTLISQAIGLIVLFGAVVVILWLLLFFSYAPQGMLLNPRRFPQALLDSVRLFQRNLPTGLGLLAVVLLARQLLATVLLRADSGTWVTAINILAHAYIVTAFTVALFIFYRDRFVVYLQTLQPPPVSEPAKQ